MIATRKKGKKGDISSDDEPQAAPQVEDEGKKKGKKKKGKKGNISSDDEAPAPVADAPPVEEENPGKKVLAHTDPRSDHRIRIGEGSEHALPPDDTV